MRKFAFYIAIILTLAAKNGAGTPFDKKMEAARIQYYEAVSDDDKIDAAINNFRALQKENPALKAVAITYIGSLTALKAKSQFFPHQKLESANNGIELMEKGVSLAPDNIESLFIRGTTLYYLPFFFMKAEQAEADLKKIVKLVNERNIQKYKPEIVKNALDFIKENIDLSDSDSRKVDKYLKILSDK